MTNINNIQDLIRILEQEPSWAKQLRSVLLSEELLNLPAVVKDLADSVKTLTENVGEMNVRLSNVGQDVATLKGDVGEMNVRLSNVEQDVATLKGDVGRLKGSDYERAVEPKAIARALTVLGFGDARAFKGPIAGVQPALSSAIAQARDAALEEGRPAPDLTETNSFLNSDIIIADLGIPGRRTRTPTPVRYALFEVSMKADPSDVARAAARAQTLANTMGVQVTPAIIAQEIPPPLRQQAEAAEVQLFIVDSEE